MNPEHIITNMGYHRLGVGDTILASDLATWPDNPEKLVAVGNEFVGQYVLDSHEPTFWRLRKDEFHTGATRSAQEGRGRFDLIPYEAMLSLARRYEIGAQRFGDRNWERGQPLSRLLSSMRRHAHQIGYDFSEDHAGAVLWNAAAFVTMVERMRAGLLPKELDDVGYFISERGAQR